MVRCLIAVEFLFLFSAFCLAQSDRDKITIVAELHTVTKNEPLSYKDIKNFCFQFVFNGRTDTISATHFGKEKYLPFHGIVEVPILLMRFDSTDFKNKHGELSLNLEGMYCECGEEKKKDSWISFRNKATLYHDKGKSEYYDYNTSYSKNPIQLDSPESLTVAVLSNYLSDLLNEVQDQENALASIFKDFRFLIRTGATNTPLTLSKIADYQRLLDLLEIYAPEFAFYQKEARQLSQRITELDSLLRIGEEQDEHGFSYQVEHRASVIAYTQYEEVNEVLQPLYNDLESFMYSLNCGVTEEEAPTDLDGTNTWKASLSVGVGYSFGDNSKDESFFLEQGLENRFFLRQQDNNNVLLPSLLLLGHVYPERKGRLLNFGLSAGIGATLRESNNAGIVYYTGATAFIGKKQELVVSAGLSYTRVDRLRTPEFAIGAEYDPIFVDPENVVALVVRASPFVAVSYNLLSGR